MSAAEPSDPADPRNPADLPDPPDPTDPVEATRRPEATDQAGRTGPTATARPAEPTNRAEPAEQKPTAEGEPAAEGAEGGDVEGAEGAEAAEGGGAEAEGGGAEAAEAAEGGGAEAAEAAEGGGVEAEGAEGGEGGGIRLRRLPQQARSRERVQRLLAAADEVLGNEGFSALTVRRLSEEAGVPVGTIYQFFADKAAVVDALARRYIGEFDEMIELLVADAEAHHWDDVVATVIDAAVAMYRSKPGYVALWTGRHLSPELMQADEANNAAIAAGLRRILVAQHGLVDDDDLARRCEVAVVTTDALLQLAFRRDPRGDEAVLGEARRLQRLYLDDIVAGRKPR